MSNAEVQILTETEYICKLRSDSNGTVALPEGSYIFVLFKENFGYSRYLVNTTNLPTKLTLYKFEENVGEPVELSMEETAEPESAIADGMVEPCLGIIDIRFILVNSYEWTKWLKTSEVHSTKFMRTIYRNYYSTGLELTWTYSYDAKVRSESGGWAWTVGGSVSRSCKYDKISGHELVASDGEDFTIYQQFTLRYEHWICELVLFGGIIIKVDEWETVFVKNIYPTSFRPVNDNPRGDDDPRYRQLGWLGTQDATYTGFKTFVENSVSKSLSVSFTTGFSSDLFGSSSVSVSGTITLGKSICYEMEFQEGHVWELYTRNTFIVYLGLHPIYGDVNDNGKVDNTDISIMYGALGSRNLYYDLNYDGKVNYADFGLELGYYLGWQIQYYACVPPGIEKTATAFGQAIKEIARKYP